MELVIRLITSSRLEVFLGTGLLKVFSKFTGEYSCQSVILALRRGRSPVNLLSIFRIPYLKAGLSPSKKNSVYLLQ